MRVWRLAVGVLLALSAARAFAQDPLPSWNEGPRKAAIVDFVHRVTTEGGRDYVAPADRIATFDNDGTLWAEQPMYFQLIFCIAEVKRLAPQHPEWKTQEPFASILKGDVSHALAGGDKALLQIVAAASFGITKAEFDARVKEFLSSATHPRFHVPYTDLVYQPMLELLAYLRANGFKTYIVSGGGVDFMRVFALEKYGVPNEQVIGSMGKLKWVMHGTTPEQIKLPEILFIDDGPGKAMAIENIIGKRPIAAFGNSNGDLEMLQWTCAGEGARLCMFIHHTDAEREWAYDRDSKIGTLSTGLDVATKMGWPVMDMRADWKVVFAFQAH